MALAAEPGVVDGAIVPNASDDILQNAPGRNMEEHIIGDDGWDARARGQVGELVEAQRIVRTAAERQRQSGAVAESLDEAAKMQRANVVRLIGHKYRDQALAISDNIRPIETALRLAAALFAKRQQPAEPRVSRTVGGIGEDRHAMGEIEVAAGDQAHARGLGGLMSADDAGEAVAVGDRQCLDAELCGLVEQFFTGTRTAQERKNR